MLSNLFTAHFSRFMHTHLPLPLRFAPPTRQLLKTLGISIWLSVKQGTGNRGTEQGTERGTRKPGT